MSVRLSRHFSRKERLEPVDRNSPTFPSTQKYKSFVSSIQHLIGARVRRCQRAFNCVHPDKHSRTCSQSSRDGRGSKTRLLAPMKGSRKGRHVHVLQGLLQLENEVRSFDSGSVGRSVVEELAREA